MSENHSCLRHGSLRLVEAEDDLEPMLDFLKQEEVLSSDLQHCAAEMVRILAAFGGQGAGYRCERKQAVRRMVSDVYSAPPVTKALSMELLSGLALDLSGEDDEGQNWDFTRVEMRKKAQAFLLKEKPPVLIGSPPALRSATGRLSTLPGSAGQPRTSGDAAPRGSST